MIVKDVIWFSGRDTIGIVAAENDMGETKFVIGRGDGWDADVDAQNIADWGSKLDLDFVNRFFERHLNKGKDI